MAKNAKVKSKYTAYFEINNGKSVYRLMEKMTPPMDQHELAEFYEREKQKGNPFPMNSIQHMELFNDAVSSRDKDLMNFIKKGLGRFSNTLTRVIYNPIGEEDEIIHNYGTSDAYSIIGNIVGKDGLIKYIDNRNALELLLKTKDIKILNKISNTINQTPMFLGRVNSKPSKKVECVVRFLANEHWIDLGAYDKLYKAYPAFLVGQVK